MAFNLTYLKYLSVCPLIRSGGVPAYIQIQLLAWHAAQTAAHDHTPLALLIHVAQLLLSSLPLN